MANYIYIATSLDGFIATIDGGLDWLVDIPNPDKSDYGFNDFIEQVDGIVMGRNTYEKVLSFGEWPYSKRVFVLSNKLKTIPEKLTDRVEILSGEPKTLIKNLNDKGYQNLYIDGGKVIQNFLDEDLIDEMIITRIPILLGEGIPLFGKLSKQIKFDLVKTEVLNELLVKSYYRIKR